MALSPPQPHRVPVLTEVIEVPGVEPALAPSHTPVVLVSERPEPGGTAMPLPTPSPMPDLLAERVLTDLQRQVDLLLEQRLREQLAPALARLTDALVRDVRDELATTLHDLVQHAIAQELARVSRG